MKFYMKSLCLLMVAMLVSAGHAFAVITVDYAGIITGVEGEVSSALTAWLPLAGVLLGIGLAWRVAKRFLS